jgi:hypothetical protein
MALRLGAVTIVTIPSDLIVQIVQIGRTETNRDRWSLCGKGLGPLAARPRAASEKGRTVGSAFPFHPAAAALAWISGPSLFMHYLHRS